MGADLEAKPGHYLRLTDPGDHYRPDRGECFLGKLCPEAAVKAGLSWKRRPLGHLIPRGSRSISLSEEGQADREGRSFSGSALHGDLAGVPLDDQFHQAQAQTAAPFPAVMFQPDKRLE